MPLLPDLGREHVRDGAGQGRQEGKGLHPGDLLEMCHESLEEGSPPRGGTRGQIGGKKRAKAHGIGQGKGSRPIIVEEEVKGVGAKGPDL